MLISGKALRYQSCSLFLNVCPHFQDHHKVHLFTTIPMVNILNISAWICIYFMTPHIFLDLSLSLESGDLLYSGIKDFAL